MQKFEGVRTTIVVCMIVAGAFISLNLGTLSQELVAEIITKVFAFYGTAKVLYKAKDIAQAKFNGNKGQ